MEIKLNKLPGSKAELAFEITPEDAKPHLESAAARLSKERPIDGYRAGHAPYDVIVRSFGEMAVYEAAMQTIVVKAYAKAVLDHKLTTYGEPDVTVKKLAPGETIAFTATVTLVPEVTKLADVRKIRVKPEIKPIKDGDVTKALEELCKMRTKETAVDRPVQAGDKVVIDMDMTVAGVPIEGGQARDHGIYLDEEYYIPGLREKLIGAQTNESRSFTLPFPKDHYQKTLAGKDVGFAVTVKQVFQLDPPAADDELAKSLGQESLTALTDLIRKNMEKEAESVARREAEDRILEKLANGSQFGDIPDAMVNQEVERMVHELSHDLEHKGIDFDQYLKTIGKSLGQLKLDFAVKALARVKTSLMMRALGQAEKIEVSDAEVMAEQTAMINRYASDPEAQKTIQGEDFLDYIKASLRNRKIMAFITEVALDGKRAE